MRRIEMLLLLLILILLSIEIFLFVKIYDGFGGWTIILMLIFSTLIGAQILYQLYFQLTFIRNELKTIALAYRGEMIFKKLLLPFIRGSLFLFPGVFTDLLAIICFWPRLPKYLGRFHQIKSSKIQSIRK